MIRRRYGHHPYYRTVVLRVRRKVVVPQMYVADTGAALTPSSAFHGFPPHTPLLPVTTLPYTTTICQKVSFRRRALYGRSART